MPSLIAHIDAIARQRKRDVLYVQFHHWDDVKGPVLHENSEAARQQIINWLQANNYLWQPCGHIARTDLMLPYLGQIYIDVPYDNTLPAYLKLSIFLENPDGSMRIPGADFCCLTYEAAMKNSHHDAPGFWEQWAKDF